MSNRLSRTRFNDGNKKVSSRPSILISHVYSYDNKGDAALLSVLLDEVRRVFDEPRITVQTMDEVAPGEQFEGAEVFPSLMSLGRFRSNQNVFARTGYWISSVLATLLWAHVYRRTGRSIRIPAAMRRVCVQYAEADLVVGVGGGYLRGWRTVASVVNVVLLTQPLRISAVLGKKTVLFSQSFGPFGWRIEELIVRRALRRGVDLVLVREDKSMALLKRIGADSRAIRSVDAGFLLAERDQVDLRRLVGLGDGKPVVGFTVRKWLRADGQDAYESAVAELADFVATECGMSVVFIPQVTSESHGDDDRVASVDVRARMVHPELAQVVTEQFDHHQIKSVYAGLDYLVGTRFHSVIFALTAGVPALAIEYEHKTSGILKDLALEQWSVPIDAVTGEDLMRRFRDLVATRERYLEILSENLPAYVERARNAADATADVFASRKRS